MIVKLLLEAGADVNARGRHGFTPLRLTTGNSSYGNEIQKILQEVLREAGAK